MVRIKYFNYHLSDDLPTLPSRLNTAPRFRTLKEIDVLQDLHSPAVTDASSEAHRHAYNAAFHLLDLSWHWDPVTFAAIHRYGRAGLKSWVEREQAHLLRAYDVDFLVNAVESTKARCLAAYEHHATRQGSARRAA